MSGDFSLRVRTSLTSRLSPNVYYLVGSNFSSDPSKGFITERECRFTFGLVGGLFTFNPVT